VNRKLDLTLYLVTDPHLSGERGVIETVRRAIDGGVTAVQLRDPHAKTRALIEQARALLAVLRPAGVPLIINDRVDVMLAARADGVHVGQLDMRVEDVRALIGPEPILGLSITALADLRSSQLQGVDYLGVGPVFATATKPDAAPAIGCDGLNAIAAETSLPVVAIGGVHVGNAAQTIRAGAQGVAVVSAICSAADPTQVARDLIVKVRRYV
jgi:thiamine-phosphate pyrophosphorylase